MPEGDSIFKIAWRLRKALLGELLESAHSARGVQGTEQLEGARLSALDSVGKHLLMHFDNGYSVHSHMGMTGSWHLLDFSGNWPKPRQRAALQLRFQRCDCVCFSPKMLRIGRRFNIERHPSLLKLGPDLLDTDASLDGVVGAMRRRDRRTIAETLLDQSIVAGIGNVYKSELLFLNRIHPSTLTASLDDDVLLKLVESARQLLLRNRQGLRRHTRIHAAGARLWVYERAGQPCLQCGAQIARANMGDPPRSTYWCPSCQDG